MLAGWLFGLPVPFILLFAHEWSLIIFANILLGINQALTWSMTLNMKIDLMGRMQRGFAISINEFSGYVSVAVVAFATGYLASSFGLKPYPFYLGIAFAVVGLAISWLAIKNTNKFVALEYKPRKENGEKVGFCAAEESDNNKTSSGNSSSSFSFKEVFTETCYKNRTLLAVVQAGLVNNLIFGMSWGLFTLYFSSFDRINTSDIGFLKLLHLGTWGVLQLATGAIGDKIGRKVLIYLGLMIESAGIWIISLTNSMDSWIIGMFMLGLGTAFVYPNLLAAISDIAHPRWRATSLGVYRFWRDSGYVFGSIGVGFLADILFSINLSIQLVAWIALASGIFVLILMRETNGKLNTAKS